MGASASIFQQYLQPVRSVADYSNEMDTQEQNKLALAASRLQAQQAQQGIADDQAMRQATMQAGGDTNKLLQALQASGNYKGAQAVQKSLLDAQKTQGEIDNKTADTAKTKSATSAQDYELKRKQRDYAIGEIASFNHPQEAIASIDRHLASGEIDQATADGLRRQIPQDPAQLAKWQLSALRALMKPEDQMKYMAPDANNAANNATSRANNAATNATSRANNEASNARMSANATLSSTQGGTAPAPKPLPVAALKLLNDAQEVADTASGVNDRLSVVESRIDSGKLKLGAVNNALGVARNFAGVSDENSRNLASFKADLEKMRNDSLRLNKGVQTDGDAQRAWNELITNINDPELVKQRLREIRSLNERARQLKLAEVNTINANYGRSGNQAGNQTPAQKPSLGDIFGK